jgi:hypothetical protein
MMVLFPDPDAPTIAVNLPSGMVREAFFRTVTDIGNDEMGWYLQAGRDR